MLIKRAATWLCIICLPVLLLTASIALAANSLSLYTNAAEKYGVRQDLDRAGLTVSDSDLRRIYADLIDYFNSGETDVSINVDSNGESIGLFTPEEIIHFRDVKGLIRLVYWLLLGTGIYVTAFVVTSLWYWRERRGTARAAALGGVLTLGLMLALGMLDLFFGFDQLFYRFHLIFFTNDFWFTPGYMLLLFPEGLFIEASAWCAGAIALAALILTLAGGLYLKKAGLDNSGAANP